MTHNFFFLLRVCVVVGIEPRSFVLTYIPNPFFVCNFFSILRQFH